MIKRGYFKTMAHIGYILILAEATASYDFIVKNILEFQN